MPQLMKNLICFQIHTHQTLTYQESYQKQIYNLESRSNMFQKMFHTATFYINSEKNQIHHLQTHSNCNKT